MGYHLRVLRSSEEASISQAEFAVAVQHIPSLVLDDDGCSARYLKEGELRSTITITDGEIWTNAAEEDVLVVMLGLAEQLKARVRGDSGESYRSVSETYVHPDDAGAVVEQHSEDRHRRRKQMIWNIIRLSLVAIVLALLIVKAFR